MSGVAVQSSRDGVSLPQVAGTPSLLDETGTAEALVTIEFAPALELVAAHAAGPLGAARVRARRPTAALDWIAHELARVGEVAALFRRGDSLLAEPVPDVQAALARLRVGRSVLEGRELAELRVALAAARAVHADLSRVAPLAPRAAELLVPLPDPQIDRRLERSVDADGTLLDSASPRLAAARREVQVARERLIRKLEAIRRGLDANAVPPNAMVTVRNGRYVIPVRRDARGRPSGIVHDESGSAGTLFIEPTDAIDLGNAFREAQVEEERETLRVLRELTDMLRPVQASIRAAVEMAIAVDDLVARARYAVAVDGHVPTLTPAPSPLVLRNARHPLLLAGGGTVVPFELELSGDERTLLVSGPNTGGKTVLLKAVGLAAALAQSGVVPPIGPDCRLPVFRRFFADIGDRQSIAASLSTFSAHVRILRRILDEADDGTLVLLDEVGSGTDPAEGGALAGAALAALTTRGTITLATTHLGSLKELAARTPGVVNGSLEFDATTLTPTFRFRKGVPGRSYGLAIARRLGVPDDVLAQAEAQLPDAERRLDRLLAAVEARAGELADAQAALEAERARTDALAAELRAREEVVAAREAELRRRAKAAEREARQQARAFLLDARRRVEAALERARAAADEAQAREARRLIEEGIAAEREALAAADARDAGHPPVPEEQGVGGALAVGMRVRVGEGTTGEVTEIRGDGRVVIQSGALRMVVDARTVTVLGRASDGGARRPARREAAPAEPVQPPPAAPVEIDLRGMTGDEAESATLAAVDAAVLAERPFLRIIHGMGTGVLRERVHRVVRNDRRVARFGFAPRHEGGSGVTIVEFTA